MKTLPAMLLLVTMAMAQSMELFTVPSTHNWPGWETKNQVQGDNAWVSPGIGYMDLYGLSPDYGKRSHLHRIWKGTAGAKHATMLFRFSGSNGQPGQIVKWLDGQEEVRRDCLSQAYVVPEVVTDIAAGLLVADVGDKWVGLHVGDVVGAFGLPVDQEPADRANDHNRFTEIVLTQKDGQADARQQPRLPAWLFLDSLAYPDVHVLVRIAVPVVAMGQYIEADLTTDGYTAWGVVTVEGRAPVYVSAPLHSAADLSGSVGINDFVPPAHACLLFQPLRQTQRKRVTAN